MGSLEGCERCGCVPLAPGKVLCSSCRGIVTRQMTTYTTKPPARTKPPVDTKDTNPKDAIGCKKPPLSTIPCAPLYEAAAGILEGACKYRRHNWRVAGIRASIYYDAIMRHLMDWWEGEDIDPKSGIHHLSKAVGGLLILRDAQIRNMAYDDRPPASPEGWLEEIQGQVDGVLERYPNPKPPCTNGGDE